MTYEEIEENKSQYRAGLIELGNWGREQDQDYWLKKILEQDGNIIVTDVVCHTNMKFLKMPEQFQ